MQKASFVRNTFWQLQSWTSRATSFLSFSVLMNAWRSKYKVTFLKTCLLFSTHTCSVLSQHQYHMTWCDSLFKAGWRGVEVDVEWKHQGGRRPLDIRYEGHMTKRQYMMSWEENGGTETWPPSPPQTRLSWLRSFFPFQFSNPFFLSNRWKSQTNLWIHCTSCLAPPFLFLIGIQPF